MKTPLLAAALFSTAIFGQTAGQKLEGRIEIFAEYSRPREVIFGIANSPSELRDQADSQYNGGGLRFMGELPGTQGWYYLLGGKLESSSRLSFNGPIQTTPVSNWDTTDISIRHSYWVAGISRLFDLGGGATVGVHGEGRGEAISAVGQLYSNGLPSGDPTEISTTYFRPWLRGSFDWTIRRSGMSPYFGLEAAVPLIKTSQSGAVAPSRMTSNTLKSMAPAFSAGIYAGLRF